MNCNININPDNTLADIITRSDVLIIDDNEKYNKSELMKSNFAVRFSDDNYFIIKNRYGVMGVVTKEVFMKELEKHERQEKSSEGF